ncbi:fibronectin type 3 and ankyrin repeat domains protein 1-like [Haliotis asinina]|uniref:fibronectin type 3 and ankyrin repeat domains protein 1-like n=1 Tax=Haliotis asinina TaxID=109174 RepID=UPI003531B2E8
MAANKDTQASTDPSPKSTVPPAPVTTKDLQASTTNASEDLTPSKTVPPAPVTTQGSDHNGTQLPTLGRDLFCASGYGDLESVKRILSAGHLNINYRGGEFSRTLVMEAARNGHRDVVDFLVGRGADVSLVDNVGDNTLQFACYNGHLETVKLMLSLNVMDINSRGRYRRTPLTLAAWTGHRNVVEFLVGRGADTSLVDSIGNNFLHFACWGGHLETAKLILSLEVLDVNARNRDGYTAADYARREGFLRHQRVSDFLISRGAH